MSIKLIILDNKKCQFVGQDLVLFGKLHSFLSYKMAGIEYSPAYQAGWSGISYLMNKKGIFPLGLLTKVKNFLLEKEIKFIEEDRRTPVKINPPIDLSEKLAKLNLVPREHQNDILQVAISNRKGIIRAATGAGKTLCAALITAHYNKPTIIYVIGLDLLKQFHDLFSSLFDEPIGYIGDGICNIERINIATIWTVGNALKIDKKSILADDDFDDKEKFNENKSEKIINLLKTASVHIFDESHVVATKTIDIIHKNINPEYIYGFSGTPFRDDNTDLLINGVLGEQIINVSASTLINKGILAQPIIQFTTIPKMRLSKHTYPTAYKEYITENDYRNNVIIEKVKFLVQKKYIPLVLFRQIKHGDLLLKKMEENNIKCAMLYGDDSIDQRTIVKNMLINKEIDVILASTIFDLGIDLPILSALVLAGGGKSSIRALQRIGRVIRGYKGKKFAAVIDFFDQCSFLKQHSISRYEIYSSEDGFKVHPSKEMRV